MTTPACPSYAGYRFPAEIISHAIGLYFRFPLSLRMVDEVLAARGIIVNHKAVRQWALKFGQDIANQIRRRLPAAGDKWHLDEVVLMIAGVRHWLWRAVDQTGTVLDILVQSRPDTHAAKRLLRKLLKRQCRAPRVMITDKLRSYAAAKREMMPSVEHRKHKGLNNRAENFHQPTRRRERQMSGSSRPARRNASCLRMAGSATCSSFAVTECPPTSIDLPGPKPSLSGRSVDLLDGVVRMMPFLLDPSAA